VQASSDFGGIVRKLSNKKENHMKYTKPHVTSSVKAMTAIQGQKGGDGQDSSHETTQSAYSGDE
jgi:hypothetical protein